MSDKPKTPLSELEKLAEELVESINEDPAMEPGQADTTPAVPTRDDSKQRRGYPASRMEVMNVCAATRHGILREPRGRPSGAAGRLFPQPVRA
jgi:hypothetical protein